MRKPIEFDEDTYDKLAWFGRDGRASERAQQRDDINAINQENRL